MRKFMILAITTLMLPLAAFAADDDASSSEALKRREIKVKDFQSAGQKEQNEAAAKARRDAEDARKWRLLNQAADNAAN